MNLGHAHKTRFWYLLWAFSKFSDEHPVTLIIAKFIQKLRKKLCGELLKKNSPFQQCKLGLGPSNKTS